MLNEKNVFDILFPSLLDVVRYNNAAPEKLLLKTGENYSSVWIGTQMAFRICCRDGKCYFEVSTKNFDFAPEDIRVTATKYKPEADYQTMFFQPSHEGVMFFANYLGQVMDTTIDSITKEYSCCSRFEECSNVGRCINPSADIAMLCGYRKIMKKGRIFYGPNRNID